MRICEMCGYEIQSDVRYYNLNGHKICADCARINTLEEIAFSNDDFDCAIVDDAIPADYTLKA